MLDLLDLIPGLGGDPMRRPRGPGFTRERLMRLEVKSTLSAIRRAERRKADAFSKRNIADAEAKRARRRSRNLALVASGALFAVAENTPDAENTAGDAA